MNHDVDPRTAQLVRGDEFDILDHVAVIPHRAYAQQMHDVCQIRAVLSNQLRIPEREADPAGPATEPRALGFKLLLGQARADFPSCGGRDCGGVDAMQVAAGRQSQRVAQRVAAPAGRYVATGERCQRVVDFVRRPVERVPQALELVRHGPERGMLSTPCQGIADDAAGAVSRGRIAASRCRFRVATVGG